MTRPRHWTGFARAPRLVTHAVPVVALLLTAALTACGSGDDGDDETVSAAGQDSVVAEQEQAELDFYECLRDKGYDVPDPDPGQKGIQINPREMGLEGPEGRAALEECSQLLPGGGPQGGDGEPADEDTLAAMREFTQCMREQGIDMPDPSADGSLQLPQGMDPESAEFQAAMGECQHLTAGHGMRLRAGGRQ